MTSTIEHLHGIVIEPMKLDMSGIFYIAGDTPPQISFRGNVNSILRHGEGSAIIDVIDDTGSIRVFSYKFDEAAEVGDTIDIHGFLKMWKGERTVKSERIAKIPTLFVTIKHPNNE